MSQCYSRNRDVNTSVKIKTLNEFKQQCKEKFTKKA